MSERHSASFTKPSFLTVLQRQPNDDAGNEQQTINTFSGDVNGTTTQQPRQIHYQVSWPSSSMDADNESLSFQILSPENKAVAQGNCVHSTDVANCLQCFRRFKDQHFLHWPNADAEKSFNRLSKHCNSVRFCVSL